MTGKKKRKKKYKIRWGRLLSCLFCLCAVIAAAAFGIDALISGLKGAGRRNADAPVVLEPQSELIEIRCVGDIMAHTAQLESASQGNGDYDFSEWFTYVKDILGDADMTLCNMEVTFPGSNYKGYPGFRTPDSLIDSVLDCGVDVACFANNHMNDSGLSGIKRSIDTMRQKGLLVTGAQYPGEQRFAIYEAKGIKIGVVNYTYETARSNGQRTMQGNILPQENISYINSFGQDTHAIFDEDSKSIISSIDAARDAGAQVIVLFLHWGQEYQASSNDWQNYIASKLAPYADVIFGSHPHVPQEIKILETKDADGSKKKVAVYMSLGNFVSNQRYETLAGTYGESVSRRTEEGEIACVKLRVNANTGAVELQSSKIIGTWVDKIEKNNKPSYHIIPLVNGYENNPALTASGNVKRAGNALKHLKSVVGESRVITDIVKKTFDLSR